MGERQSGSVMHFVFWGLAALVFVSVTPAAAQDKPGFKFFGEVNVNYRDSAFEEFRLTGPFSPAWWEAGDDGVYLRTVDPGSHYELSDVELGLDVTFSDRWAGRVLVHVEDLYNRNPTSIDDRVFVREFWLRYGQVDPKKWTRDGPMLMHGLQGLHHKKIILPRPTEQRPNPNLLEKRYERFRAVG